MKKTRHERPFPGRSLSPPGPGWRGASALLLPLFLGLGGCGSTPPPRPKPLTREERDLFQQAEMNLKAGREAWWEAWKRIALDPRRARFFAKGILAWLFADFSRLEVSPDLFGRVLEENPRGLVWKRVLAGLERMGEPAVSVCMAFLKEGRDPIARGFGAQVAGRLGPGIVPPLVDLLEEGSPLQAAAAARALGFHKESPQAGKALLRAAKDASDYRVRGAALRALGRYGGAEAGALLVETLRSEKDPFLVMEAAKGLGFLGEKRAVPALIAAMEKGLAGKNKRLVQAVEFALQRITGRRFGPRPNLWKVWWAKEVQTGPAGGGEKKE